MKTYTLEKKPDFKQDDEVYVKMSCFGLNTDEIRKGRIVGITTRHIIDLWLVDFGKPFSETYPYSTVGVSHTFIVDDSLPNPDRYKYYTHKGHDFRDGQGVKYLVQYDKLTGIWSAVYKDPIKNRPLYSQKWCQIYVDEGSWIQVASWW